MPRGTQERAKNWIQSTIRRTNSSAMNALSTSSMTDPMSLTKRA